MIEIDIVGLPTRRSTRRTFERETVRRAILTYFTEKMHALRGDIRIGFLQEAEGSYQESSVIAYLFLSGAHTNPSGRDYDICSEVRLEMCRHVYEKVPFAFLSQGFVN